MRDLAAGWVNDLVKRQALLTLAGMKTGIWSSEIAAVPSGLPRVEDERPPLDVLRSAAADT